MKVLHVIDSLRLGGAESVLHNTALHLQRNYHDVGVEVLTLYEVGHFGRQLQSEGIKVRCLQMCSKYDLRGLPRMVELISPGHHDIVHVHLFPANYLSSVASVFCPDPQWVFTEHSVWNRRRKYRLARIVERLMYQRFTHIIAVSQQVACELLRWLPGIRPKLKVIPNGVPVMKPKDWPAREPKLTTDGRATLLFVGRMHPAKGVDVLLEAIAGLTRRDYELLIIGDGDLRAQLETHANELGLSGVVRFLGERTDVAEIMQTVDCLLITSRWEGLPMILLEGMAAGLPVIASSCGGMPEVIVDGDTGYLVTPEQPDELRARISFVLSNLDSARSVGKRARRKIEDKYSIEITTRQLVSFYEQVLAP